MPANSNAASKKSQGNLSKKSQSNLSRRSQRFEVDEEIATKEFFVTKRYCRDVIFLLLFAAFWFGMILVAMNAFRTGDPKRIVIPQDYLGNYCGIDNTNSSLVVANAYSNQTANPYLYYFSIQDLTNATHICVKECPKETKALSVSNYLCRYDITPTILNYATLVQKFHCAAYTLASSPILNRCIPGVSSSTDNSTTSSNDILSQSRDFAVRVLSDLQVTWKVIAVGAGVSMILSFIWMLLLQYLAGLIVWVCIIGCNIFFVFGSIWLYLYWQANLALLNQTTITGIQAQINSIVGINDSTTVFVSKSNTDVLQWTFIVMAVIGVLLLLITIGMFKRVVIAVGVIKQASLAMKKMPLIIFFPFLIWAAIAINIAYFLYVGAYIITPGGPQPFTLNIFNTVLSDPNISNYIIGYHIFGFLWTLFFLLGVNQMSIAGAIANWYFTMDKTEPMRLPVMRSLFRTLVFHLGSIAVGSMLIAIVEFIRILLFYIQRNLKKSGNQYLQYLLACIQCCLACVSVLVKFINRNAYIFIAIKGKAFFNSAGEATALLIRNALRVAAIDFVSDFVLFLSKMIVVTACGFGAYFYLAYFGSALGTIAIPWVTVVLVVISSYFVSSAFISVYQMAIDTIFICFLIDSESNDGSAANPYYMTEGMQNVMGVENKQTTKSRRTTQQSRRGTVHVEEF